MRIVWQVYQIVRYLGLRWLLFRAFYALKLRLGWFRWRLPLCDWAEVPTGRIRGDLRFVPELTSDGRSGLGSDQAVADADRILAGWLTWFSEHQFQVGFPPDWFWNPWGEPASEMPGHVRRHWSEIGDFSGGDIKGVWELSRFGLVFTLVRAFAHSGDGRYVEAFWRAVEDWRANNPPQCGVHWKCGQEIALRLIAWSFGFLAFRTHPATTERRQAMLAEMIEVSARRIELNIGYALSQKNNHGVSEATGLLTAGILLERPAWANRGRHLLESLAAELIYDDGSFSQHSVNYHRLMLHDYLWAIRLSESAAHPLPPATIERVRRAGLWLRAILCPQTGQVPNLGANDGAHLLDLTDLGYHDFRPTVQAVGLLTTNQRWLPAGPWDELCEWLGGPRTGHANECSIPEPCSCAAPVPGGLSAQHEDTQTASPDEESLQEFPDGGYAVWRAPNLLAVLRCPRRFRHRPGNRDFLHFDLWFHGHNLLVDAGSYSYNCPEPWASYFASSAAHNTIRFDDRDPLPRITRFLHGAWPISKVELAERVVTASFRDYRRVYHGRRVQRTDTGFLVTDQIDGDFQQAVLRLRLNPEQQWTQADGQCTSALCTLTVRVEPAAASATFRLAEGWQSLVYQQKTPLPVFEVQVGPDCRTLVTEIRLYQQPMES